MKAARHFALIALGIALISGASLVRAETKDDMKFGDVMTPKTMDTHKARKMSIAESNDVPYEIRCEAALALRQMKAAPLQSAVEELNLLSSQSVVTEAQASASAYTFPLRRLAATQTQDANVKFRLQAAALAIRPSDTDVRRDLFRAAIQSRRFVSATSLVATDGASIDDLKLLVDAYLRQGRNDEAVETARRLTQLRATGGRRLLEIARGAQELQHANEQRMPVIHENYDQNNVVRPKLAGGAR